MRKLLIALVPAALAATTVTTHLGEPESVVEFNRAVTSASKSFEKQDFLATGDYLRRALGVANEQLKVAVEVQMPKPPAGMQPVERLAGLRRGAGPGGADGPMGSMIARPVEKSYRDVDGGSHIRIRVQPNDPRARRVREQMADENVATRFESQDRPFVIQKLGPTGFTVRTLLADQHMFEVIWQGVDEETMLLWVRDLKMSRIEGALTGQR